MRELRNTNISQGLTNPIVRKFQTTELYFADLKNHLVDHFREATKMIEFDRFNYGEFATINRLSLTAKHF